MGNKIPVAFDGTRRVLRYATAALCGATLRHADKAASAHLPMYFLQALKAL